MAEENNNLPLEETVPVTEEPTEIDAVESDDIAETDVASAAEVETEIEPEAEEEAEVTTEKETAKTKKDGKKSDGLWKKFKKLCSDTVNEMKKVRWTPADELKKNTVLVVITVVVIAAALGLIDSFFSWIFTSIAELV